MHEMKKREKKFLCKVSPVHKNNAFRLSLNALSVFRIVREYI